MKHLIFNPTEEGVFNPCAILIKTEHLKHDQITKHYVDPLAMLGMNTEQLMAFNLEYKEHNKAPATLMKAYLKELLLIKH